MLAELKGLAVWVCQLDAEKQALVKAALEKKGLSDDEVQDAMDSKLVDLEDVL